MLVLSAHCNDRIVIGDRIVLTVVAIQGGKIRLGFEASRDIPIYRESVIGTDATEMILSRLLEAKRRPTRN